MKSTLFHFYSSKEEDYFSHARHEILDLTPQFSRRVLDVGCGSGQTLEMLKDRKLCAETIGIELFGASADQARGKADEVYCLDVEKDGLPDKLGRFDLILLLDVLEHLVDPWSFLQRLIRDHLADAGKVIVSLPNARHISLVIPLLFGRFTYGERGVLDKTHLRFFTKDSAADLLRSASLHIEQVRPVRIELRSIAGKLNLLTAGLLSGFFVGQYLFLASAGKRT